MKRQRKTLGELCKLVKGTSPISKTTPGTFVLVTTGEKHKTADTFQFEDEAVCIPLISSTGHGHASLKRVHYQTGKFALGNLLAAALVKDKSVLSTRFLARYLMFTKDTLIVPLMTGVANMSISIDRLATVPIEFPSLAEQEQIVKLLDEADELRNLRSQADYRTADLLPALFHDVFVNFNTQGHPIMRLGDVAEVKSGSGFPLEKQGLSDQSIPFFKVGDMNTPGNETAMQVFQHSISEVTRKELGGVLLPPGSVVFPKVGGAISTNKKRTLISPSCVDNNVMAILPSDKLITQFLLVLLETKNLSDFASDANPPSIRKTTVEDWKIPVPPLSVQKEFAKRVTEIHEIAASQATSRTRLDALFQSMSHRAFNGGL